MYQEPDCLTLAVGSVFGRSVSARLGRLHANQRLDTG
jgi:hypothetical protein